MATHENKRFPKSALKRYAEMVLRHVYQSGGRERYVPVSEIEDAIGLEEELIITLCRTRLMGEVHVADRAPVELLESAEYESALEQEIIRECFARPHVRIRPESVRLTSKELLPTKKKRKKRRP